MKWPALLVGAALLGAITIEAVQAQAQTVYRCGNEYSQAPCPNGKPVDTADPRTPEQRAQAERLNASEARRTAEMRRERLAEQATQKPASAASLSAAPAAQPASAAGRKAPKHKHASKLHTAKPPAGTPFTARNPQRPAPPKP